MTVRSFVSDMSDMTMLAQKGQNYEHVHIISITHISFSYVQISVSIQIRRSRETYHQSRVHISRSRVEIRWSGSWNSSKWKLKFVVEVYGRSRQTNRRSRMLKHFFVQYDNFFTIYTEYLIIMHIIMSNRMQPQCKYATYMIKAQQMTFWQDITKIWNLLPNVSLYCSQHLQSN
jgi:hypothetical protein